MNGFIGNVWGMGKIWSLQVCFFIYLKVTSEKSVPEVSIIHFSQFGSHRFCENGGINFINFYLITLEKAKLNASIRYIVGFSKSEIPIYNSEDLDMAGRKTRRRTQAIANPYAFQANAKNLLIISFKITNIGTILNFISTS